MFHESQLHPSSGIRAARVCAVLLSVFGAACASNNPASGGTGGSGVSAGGSLAMAGASGASGGGATAGAGGAGGGAGGAFGVVSCGSDNPDDLIADFTTDNGDHAADGRTGGWYVFGDPTPQATFDPPLSSDPTAAYPIDLTTGNATCSGGGSFHFKSTGFATWGSAMATDFVAKIMKADGTPVKGGYDASKYTGISFWAKATAPVKFVQIKFPDLFSTATADPSVVDPTYTACVDGLCGFPNGCSPYIVKLAAPVDDANYPKYVTTQIGTDWKRFDILFADAKPDKYCTGFDPLKMLDLKHLVGFVIQVNADFSVNASAPTANDSEIWIDDVRFIR